MADLRQFSRNIKRRARAIEVNANIGVARVMIAVAQTVVLATPVDTGRARANWIASLGSPVRLPTNDEDPSGQETIAVATAVAKARKAGSGIPIFLANNVDYIAELNRGSSAQAPAGFVEVAVAQGVAVARGIRLTKLR